MLKSTGDNELAFRMMWAALHLKKQRSKGGVTVARLFCRERNINRFIIERALREIGAVRGGTATLDQGREAVANALFGENVGRKIRGTHPYCFRSGQWAHVHSRGYNDGVPVYIVVFDDGRTDLWPIEDATAGYEFKD